MTHDVSLFPTPREGNRRPHWFAACRTCQWTGEARDNGATATHDAAEHLRLNAPKGKDT